MTENISPVQMDLKKEYCEKGILWKAHQFCTEIYNVTGDECYFIAVNKGRYLQTGTTKAVSFFQQNKEILNTLERFCGLDMKTSVSASTCTGKKIQTNEVPIERRIKEKNLPRKARKANDKVSSKRKNILEVEASIAQKIMREDNLDLKINTGEEYHEVGAIQVNSVHSNEDCQTTGDWAVVDLSERGCNLLNSLERISPDTELPPSISLTDLSSTLDLSEGRPGMLDISGGSGLKEIPSFTRPLSSSSSSTSSSTALASFSLSEDGLSSSTTSSERPVVARSVDVNPISRKQIRKSKKENKELSGTYFTQMTEEKECSKENDDDTIWGILKEDIQHLDTGYTVCEICNEGFISEDDLRKHLQEIHEASYQYRCFFCKVRFQNLYDVLVHKKEFHPMAFFKCKYCGMNGCRHTGTFLDHLSSHFVSGIYQCSMCDRRFKTKNDRLNHINDVHCPGSFPNRCDECGKVFKYFYQLKDHHQFCHNEQLFVCEECGNEFKKLHNLLDHKNVHKPPSLQCPRCPLKFCQRIQLRFHMRTHNKGSFHCTVCSKSFSYKCNLERHYKLHC